MASEAVFNELEYYQNYKLDAGEIDLRSYLLDEEHLEEKVLTGEYPTIHVLQDLQRQKGEGPRDPDSKSEPPFPPRRRKNEIFDATKFVEKDAYVSSLLPEPAESDESFAERLFAKCSSNLDKVRAAFVFVSSAKVDSMSEVENESALYTQVRKLHANDGADALFQKLAQLGQVPLRIIVGYKKGAGYEIGHTVRTGKWAACYVEGEWRFVDAHWGSTSLVGYESGTYAEVGRDGDLKDMNKSDGVSVWATKEFYFLTDPDQLILSHFPMDALEDEWQLLVRPLSLQQFERMPNYFQGHSESTEDFISCVRPLSHPMNVIVAAPGNINVVFLETEGQVDLSSTISIHSKDVNEENRTAIKTKIEEGGYLSRPTRMGEGKTKFIFVPPCPGKFKLKISLQKLTDRRTVHFVSYVIHCPLAENPRPRPKGVELPSYFGPGKELSDVGLISKDPGEILAADGEHTLIFQATDQRSRVPKFQLIDASNNFLPTKNLIAWIVETKLFILFLSPDSGTFVLLIHENDAPVCQFLLDAPSEYRDAAEFPVPDLEQFGGLGFFDSQLNSVIQPVSHIDPYFVCNESSIELTFRMNEIQAEIEAELVRIGLNGQNSVSRCYSFVSSFSSQSSNVSLRFPTAGHFVLRLNARQRRSDLMRPYCNYFIRSIGKLKGRVEKFPEPTTAWRSSNQLVLPRLGVLPVNETVQFAISLSDPNVNSVYLVVNNSTNHRFPLMKNQNGVWKGKIPASKDLAGRPLKVVSETQEKNRNICEDLLNYNFESKKDCEIKNQEIQEAAELNKRRRTNEAWRQRKQENYRREQNAMELLPEDPGEPVSEEDTKKTSRKKEKLMLRSCLKELSHPDNKTTFRLQHKTVQAALLLLGHCEDETMHWDRCRAAMRQCSREQPTANLDKINPSIAARAQEILKNVDENYVSHRATQELRKWASSRSSMVLRERRNTPPASRAAQRRILGVPEYLHEAWL